MSLMDVGVSNETAMREAAVSLGLSPARDPHRGMPALDRSGPPVSHFEFWPAKLFYAPVIAWCVLLALRYRGVLLPTAANPGFPAGGLVGESKYEIFAQATGAAREALADFTGITASGDAAHDLAAARRAMAEAGLTFPVVMKPDMGCRGVGVQLARDEAALRAYLGAFPRDHRVVLQAYVTHEAEAGVFYVRKPGEQEGRILSITLKYFPHVRGDGRRTLKQLIEEDERAGILKHLYLPRHAARLDSVIPEGEHIRLAFAGSHSRGTIFRDGTAYATDAMRAAFDRIADDLPGFHFGRFDVRAASLEALRAGRDFKILEINGAGGEATHIWDRNMTLGRAYKALFEQFKLAYEIGALNRKRGHRPTPVGEVIRLWRLEKHLWSIYPPTQ